MLYSWLLEFHTDIKKEMVENEIPNPPNFSRNIQHKQIPLVELGYDLISNT